ncbi:hypothetical protein F6I42_08455 [Corynebacterium amycolatum]|uniref:hypothetical protein n=1 Tax=Corynebacterium TaxID=1716 RepID=UPI0008A3080B|nr:MULTISPECIES: hypothetical protein [Corynebacterium]KAA9225414.1 hypothetical protein F6I42_08455 [Corynebacterium amycolatum]OFM15951.1 hypothetical protein HMPREF2714_04025 [Corynebacterium sp. HMSC077G01]
MTLILEPEEGLEALGEINRLAQLDDGSGIIEPQLISYLDSLGDDAYDMPCLRIAGQTLLGEVLTGLGEDERVAEVLRRNIQDSVVLPGMSEEEALQARAAQVVVVRLLRIIARMEAVELRNVVAQQCLASQIPPVVRVALTLTVDILDAVRLDAHPDDMVRVVLDYADQVLWLADDDLNAYFAELEMIVQQREKDLEFGRFGEPGAARFG